MADRTPTLLELKAAAYDLLAQMEQIQRQLAIVNQQIANWREPAPDPDIPASND